MSTVFLADCRRGNIRVLQEALAEAGHTGVGVDGATDIPATLAASDWPVVGVVDLSGLGGDARPVCDRLCRHGIPFVALVSHGADTRRTWPAGARAIMQKPVARAALLDLVRSLADAVETEDPPEAL